MCKRMANEAPTFLAGEALMTKRTKEETGLLSTPLFIFAQTLDW
jgi:hypothetical protein